MSSPDPHAERDARAVRPLARVLDLAFGFFMWAAHFIILYAATALACVLGLGGASPGAKAGFDAALVLITLVVAALVLWHAQRRYRQQHDQPDLHFRLSVTVGGDAIASVAILWQLFPILLLPPCA